MENNTDARFTRLLVNHITNAKEFMDYGIERGLTSPSDLRLTIAKRQEVARQLVDKGMSLRKVSKVLGVSHTTVRRTVEQSVPKNGTKCSKAAVSGQRNGSEKLHSGHPSDPIFKKSAQQSNKDAIFQNAIDVIAGIQPSEVDHPGGRALQLLKEAQRFNGTLKTVSLRLK